MHWLLDDRTRQSLWYRSASSKRRERECTQTVSLPFGPSQLGCYQVSNIVFFGFLRGGNLDKYRLIPNARSYPFHLQIARSLLHLTRHTKTYVPLSPYLLPILTSALTPSTKPKSSTFRPLDLEVYIRTPAQYLKTRLYAEGLVEETSYLFAEWLGNAPTMTSIAFPELIVPISISLRRLIKRARSSKHGNGKDVGVIKGFVERVEESAKWVEIRRKDVAFGPSNLVEVERWETDVKVDESPLGKYLKVARKTREKRRQMLEKVGKYLFVLFSRRWSAGCRREKVKLRWLWKMRTSSQL